MVDELIMGPPEEIINSMKDAFILSGFGGVPYWTDRGCAFVMYADKKTCLGVKNVPYYIAMELHKVNYFPLIRFLVIIFDQPDNPFKTDFFLNVDAKDRDHIPLLNALKEQSSVSFFWFDENFEYQGSTKTNWGKDQRETAKMILEVAEEVLADGCEYSFKEAKEKFMRENPL